LTFNFGQKIKYQDIFYFKYFFDYTQQKQQNKTTSDLYRVEKNTTTTIIIKVKASTLNLYIVQPDWIIK
jgi:hypothetical protein